jgi:hypothetical protein
MNDKKISLAAEAYIYGYPLVYNLHEMTNTITKPGLFHAPLNVFGYARKLAGPETKFVSVNNDTLYTVAIVDVTEEPQVLHLPDTNGRYYVMQFVDAWTNNFAYPGKRATGTKEVFFLLTGPGWQGETPQGMQRINAPSNLFAIVGRYAVDQNDEDVKIVNALQDDTWLTPLSRYPEKPDNSERKLGDRDPLPYDKRVGEDYLFWEQLRSWMKLFPPPEAEKEYIKKFESLGLLADESPYVNPSPELVEMLKPAKAEAVEFIKANLALGEPVNGWRLAPHIFDYNLDYFEVGTDPTWAIKDRAKAHIVRAVAARVGLWGNHGYEANYLQVYEDGNGDPLSGEHKYVLHFDAVPPVDAFWSITMYNMPDFYLVENPINRYAIGDRTTGLKFNDDGSLDIYMQYESPGAEKESNWLPTPKGKFRPILREYSPHPEALDGTWVVPPIKRVD